MNGRDEAPGAGACRDGKEREQATAVPVGPIVLRLPTGLVDEMRRDLRRPHPYAFERVGFLTVTSAPAEGGELIVLGLEYAPVPDGHYVPGRGAGARIGTAAIREAVTRTMVGGRGVFHVHLHEHDGVPRFSPTDRREQPRLVQSLAAAAPAESHGMLVLSGDAANAWVWPAGGTGPVVPARLMIVGDPMVLLSGDVLTDRGALDDADDEADAGELAAGPADVVVGALAALTTPADGGSVASAPADRVADRTSDSGGRYSRQSFLGPDSQRRLELARVAVLGYGGGGSHVGQQLAHVGVRHVSVADGDQIDESNLNRLVGGTADDVRHARRKVDIARRSIAGVLPGAPIVTHDGRWQERPLHFRGCDVLVGCVDSFAERRELEILARRFGLAYVDIGMDVHEAPGEPPRMGGQVILSLPGGPCMTCLGFLTPERLAAEAAHYGAVGSRPQVVWPNGVLASAAVGVVVSLLTGWTGEADRVVYLSYDGNRGTLVPHPRLQYLGRTPCPHFPLGEMGLPRFAPARVARRAG